MKTDRSILPVSVRLSGHPCSGRPGARLYVCIHVYVCIYISLSLYIYIYMHTYIHIRTYTHIYIYIYIYMARSKVCFIMLLCYISFVTFLDYCYYSDIIHVLLCFFGSFICCRGLCICCCCYYDHCHAIWLLYLLISGHPCSGRPGAGRRDGGRQPSGRASGEAAVLQTCLLSRIGQRIKSPTLQWNSTIMKPRIEMKYLLNVWITGNVTEQSNPFRFLTNITMKQSRGNMSELANPVQASYQIHYWDNQ